MARYVYGLASAIGISPVELNQIVRRNVLERNLQSVVVKTVFQPDISPRFAKKNPYYLAIVFNPDRMELDDCRAWLDQFLKDCGLRSRVTPHNVGLRDQQELEEFLRNGSRELYSSSMSPENWALPMDSSPLELSEDSLSVGWGGYDWMAQPIMRQPYTGPASLAWDRVLTWLSAAGSGSWSEMEHVVAKVMDGLESPMTVIQVLQLLGHLQWDFNSFTWRIRPTTAVVNEGSGILAGERTSETIRSLMLIKGSTSLDQTGAPSLIKVGLDCIGGSVVSTRQGEKDVQIYEMVKDSELKHWSVWKSDIIGGPSFFPGVDENMTNSKQVQDANTGRWKNIGPNDSDCGLVRLSVENGKWRYACRDAIGTWYRGSITDLRFLAGKEQDILDKILLESNKLIVPVWRRWPLAYERHLIMQSGMRPGVCIGENGKKLLSYEIQDKEGVFQLAEKLNIEVVEA